MRTFSVAVLTLVLTANTGLAQQQYKRVHQNAYKQILNGKAQAALNSLDAFLNKYPEDAESHYMRAVALTALDRTDDALKAVRAAIDAGVSPERFVTGTKTGLDALRPHLPKDITDRLRHEPAHGPMLGCLTGNSVKVWLRTIADADVQAIASTSPDLSDPILSPVVKTNQNSDFTAVAELTGLKPRTTYHYTLNINGQRANQTWSFTTFPETGEPVKFRLAFGGGAGFVPPHERMWDTIRSHKPDALLLLGDNVYIDDPTTPAMQHYTYYRRQSRPEYRQLIATTPVYSIWDDHDFGTNDCSGGPLIDKPAWKRPVYQVFRNNWVNPGYGRGEEHPGCYYDFMIGDVHFIMLDGRYYRNLKPEDEGRSSMLGPVQRKWFLDTLQSSTGRLKVLCSPVPWVFEAKGDSKDTWNGFKEERKIIFDFLAENNIEGVILMSADRHRSDLWKIERPNGYSLYELNSSRLTNQHVHPTMKAAMFSYNQKQSFGLVEIDTTADDPTTSYTIVSIDDEKVHTHTVKGSELTHR